MPYNASYSVNFSTKHKTKSKPYKNVMRNPTIYNANRSNNGKNNNIFNTNRSGNTMINAKNLNLLSVRSEIKPKSTLSKFRGLFRRTKRGGTIKKYKK